MSTDGRPGIDPGFARAEQERKISSMIQTGRIVEADYTKGRVKVDLGDGAVSNWLRFAQTRTGPNSTWEAPEVGEQVVVMAPAGCTEQAIVWGSLSYDGHPAVGDSEKVHSYKYEDGTVISYDREAHKLDATVHPEGTNVVNVGPSKFTQTKDAIVMELGGSKITLSTSGIVIEGASVIVKSATGSQIAVGSGTQMQGDFDINGNLHASGDVLNDGANSNHHTH